MRITILAPLTGELAAVRLTEGFLSRTPEKESAMAFTLCEKDNIQWVMSDVLGTKHLFSRRLGDVGDFPFSSKPDPEWESESRQERVRALWQRFRTAAEFPAEGFCFTRQVHGTVLRYVTEAERAMPPLPHPPEDCDGLITDRKDVLGEYVNRVYYFYSDEDVFYVICESRKENSEAAAKEFDEFISSVTITKK